jgi:hypothetical protein
VGGFGSGHWYPNAKLLRENCWPLSADQLARAGFCVAPGGPLQTRWRGWEWRDGSRISLQLTFASGTPHLFLDYALITTDRASGQEIRNPIQQAVSLEALSTPWRATRWYFRCPSCGRRAGKLYLPCRRQSGRCFRCRICHGLTYRTRVASRHRPIPPAMWRRLSEFFGEPEDPTYFRFYDGWGVRRRLR